MRWLDGLLMALADSVPGVSGGTVAFLLGFYEEWMEALRYAPSRNRERRRRAWYFLMVLGAGWVAGMALALLFLNALIENHIYAVSAVFWGLVFASLPVIAWKERRVLREKPMAWPMLLVGFVPVFVVTKLSLGSGMDLSLTRLTPAGGLVLFVAAAAAASAMVLPGISGSSLLMAFGLYLPVVRQASALAHGQLSALPVVLVFGLGAATGLCGFVRLVNRALIVYRAQTMYAVLGMMIASLYAVVMGPLTLNASLKPLNLSGVNLLYALFGALIIVGFTALERLRARQNHTNQWEESYL